MRSIPTIIVLSLFAANVAATWEALTLKAPVLAVTHDEKNYDRLDRVFDLRDGHLSADHAPNVGGAS